MNHSAKSYMNRIRIGLSAGFITVAITTVLNLATRALGVLPEAMDLKYMAEFMIDPLQRPAAALALGIVVHLIAGSVIGMAYALIVKSLTALSGVLFMLPLWFGMMLVALPLTHRGLFGLSLGPSLAIATFILHVVFGALIGTIAGKMKP